MFFVRADGNSRIGAGHLMRCMTIAEEIKKKEEVLFLCAEEESAQFAIEKGYPATTLNTIPFSQEEAEAVIAILQKEQNPKILIDSYACEEEYTKKIHLYANIACMDDMMDKKYPSARWVINYNAFAKSSAYVEYYKEFEHAPQFLLGADYIPIRTQFLEKDYQVEENITDVLLTTGGGDDKNIAGQIMEELLQHEDNSSLIYHIVCGSFNPNKGYLLELAKKNTRIRIHENVQDMAGLMSKCDIAITAGGTTIYELCAIGVPFVCFSYARNQDRLVEFIGKNNIGIAAESLDKIKEGMKRLLDSRSIRARYSEAGKTLVDGCGATRLAKILCGE